jgi:hypothetical protein
MEDPDLLATLNVFYQWASKQVLSRNSKANLGPA